MKIIIVVTTLIGLATGASAQSLNDTIRRQEWQQSNQLMLDTMGWCNLAIAMGTKC